MSALRDRILGCLAASQIGSAMGAAVEGWDWRAIRDKYGVLEELLPYEHYGNGWLREPGTTEDGIERQRVFLRAIRRAGGRIGPEDVQAVWRDEVDPSHAQWVMEPFDRYVISLPHSDIPAVSIGSFNPHTTLISLARSCHPIGLINALDPERAWRDVHHVGLVLQSPVGNGLDWAGLVAAVIAAACAPDARIDDAIETGLSLVSRAIEDEVRSALEVAQGVASPLELREAFEGRYNITSGIPYAMSQANEIVSKALALATATGGGPRDTVVAAVNLGRDTDCLAAVAGGIAGAISGVGDLPGEWLEQLDRATEANPHTCLKLSLSEMADIVLDGLAAEAESMRRRLGVLSGMAPELGARNDD